MPNMVGALKPDGQKVTRNAPKFDWESLPASGRVGPPPKLPPARKWTKATRDAWARVWAKPQAVMWDQSGDSMLAWAICHHEILIADDTGKALGPLMAEMRQVEDRHGLNPKALLQLRWRIVDDEGVAVSEISEAPRGRTPARRRLTVVD